MRSPSFSRSSSSVTTMISPAANASIALRIRDCDTLFPLHTPRLNKAVGGEKSRIRQPQPRERQSPQNSAGPRRPLRRILEGADAQPAGKAAQQGAVIGADRRFEQRSQIVQNRLGRGRRSAPARRDRQAIGDEPGVKMAFGRQERDRKSTRLNSSHVSISYAVFCL